MNEPPAPHSANPSADAAPPLPPSVESGSGAFEAVTGPLSPTGGDNAATPSNPGRKPATEKVLVPGYEVLEELGRGGMAVVYKARQIGLKRLVALKMILAGSHASPEERLRFRTEAEAVARLQHPHIVQIYEIGEHAGHLFFSLEFCAGGSLDRRLRAGRPTPSDAAALLEKLAGAVHAAHAHNVVHRDLKPANVLLLEDGTPKVSDFGLARKLDEAGQTGTGLVLGTPYYMAPEQAAGKNQEVGPAADVWALGAILYELLTGRPPFQAGTALDTLLQVLNEEPVPVRRLQPNVPRELETVCLKCLQKEPARRYTSAEALAEDLRRFQAGESVQAQRPPWWRDRRARRAARVLASLALACALGWPAVKWAMRDTQPRPAALSLEEARYRVVTAENQCAEARRTIEEHADKVQREKAIIDNSRRQAQLARQHLQTVLDGYRHGRFVRGVEEAHSQLFKVEDEGTDAAERLEELERASPQNRLRQAEADLATARLQLAETDRAAGQPADDLAALRRKAADHVLAAASARHDDALRAIERHASRTERLNTVIAGLRRREQEVEKLRETRETRVKIGLAPNDSLLAAEALVLQVRQVLARQVKMLEEHQREDPRETLRRAEAEVKAARERLDAAGPEDE